MNKIVILGHRSVLSLFTQPLDLQPLRQQKRRLRIASFEASHLRGWGSLLKRDNVPPQKPTVTQQNGFSSTITTGVPTFYSRL